MSHVSRDSVVCIVPPSICFAAYRYGSPGVVSVMPLLLLLLLFSPTIVLCTLGPYTLPILLLYGALDPYVQRYGPTHLVLLLCVCVTIHAIAVAASVPQ